MPVKIDVKNHKIQFTLLTFFGWYLIAIFILQYKYLINDVGDVKFPAELNNLSRQSNLPCIYAYTVHLGCSKWAYNLIENKQNISYVFLEFIDCIISKIE